MREIWFADNRDLIKWGILVHLAREHGIKTILQVPYRRPDRNRPHFLFADKRLPVADDVWQFFRDMQRIEKLGGEIGVDVKVVGEEFSHTSRSLYLDHVCRHLRESVHPLLLFFDPDTGIQPKKLEVTHATEIEVGCAWANLRAGDWLVFYQHARRTPNWSSEVAGQLSEVCGGRSVVIARSKEIGRDVAFLCIEKPTGPSHSSEV